MNDNIDAKLPAQPEHNADGTVKPGYLPVAPIEHKPRVTDTDPKAARRAERQVASMFALSMVLVVVFVIGAGAIQWAKKLMPDVEVVQERHSMESPTGEVAEAAGNYERGKEESGFARYPIIRRTLLGAMALFPIPLVVLLRDLWQAQPGESPVEILSSTSWNDGMRIVPDIGHDTGENVEGIRPEEIPVGGLVSALPLSIKDLKKDAVANMRDRGKSAIILVRMDPEEIRSQQGEGWDSQGILAYSKICTHVGCPIALYEHRTHHLLCPCHQSSFDLADSGNVIFGPAARRMPQLPIHLDEGGFLVASSDFQEPVGPSFWERG